MPSSSDVAPWKENSQPMSVAIGGAPEPTRELRHVLGFGPTRGTPSAGLLRPQYRLRVVERRVFYDVQGHAVQILRILPRRDVEHWPCGEGERS